MYVCSMYVVWYVNFKISLLVDTMQSWPLIGRHDKGSSDVTVLEHSILYTEADCSCCSMNIRWRLILGAVYYVCRKFGSWFLLIAVFAEPHFCTHASLRFVSDETLFSLFQIPVSLIHLGSIQEPASQIVRTRVMIL